MSNDNTPKLSPIQKILIIPLILTSLALPIWMYWEFHVVFGFLRFLGVAFFLIGVLGVTTFLSKPRRVKDDTIVYNPTELPLILGWIVGLLALFYMYMHVKSSIDLTTIQYGFGLIHLVIWGLMANALLLHVIQNRNNQITFTPSGIEILKSDSEPIHIQWTNVLSVQKDSKSSTIVLKMEDESTHPISLGDFNMVDNMNGTFMKDLTAFLGEEKIASDLNNSTDE